MTTMTKETLEYLEQLQTEENRKQFKKLLSQSTTRVQLGTLITIADIQMFKVKYELTGSVSLNELDKLKDETGLTVLFITLVHNLTTETDDVDGQFDECGEYSHKTVVTSSELDIEYLYTYY